jgi:outer membrane protein TolC
MNRRPTPALVLLALALLARVPGAAAAASAPLTLSSADTLHLSLEQAVARALGAGSQMQVARASVGIAEGRVLEALAEALPQITGTVSYNRKFDSIFRGLDSADSTGLGSLFANSPFGAVHGWSMDLTASQLLWSSGRVGAGLAAARAARASVASDRDQAGADVTLAVQQAYWNVLYAREVQVIARHGLDQAREHLRQVELYRKQGTRSEYDLLRAQVDAANQEPAVVAARSAVELAMLSLKRTLNLPLARPLVLDSPLAFADAQLPVPIELPASAAARPAVKSAEAAVRARRAVLRVENSGRWPQLMATATMSHQAFPADGSPARDQFHRSVDATLKLEWPLFQGFRTFGNVRRATNELRQAMAVRDEMQQLAEVELAQARLGVDEARATLAARRGTAKLAERAHYLADVRWRNGIGTQLEVSDARLQMLDAQVNEVLALKEYRLSLARLDRAAGHAVPTTNKSIDDLSFDPTPHEER